MDTTLHLLNGGAGNLAAYLAAHVLLCLLPAFFIAGAMAALIPKASITRWLGRSTSPRVSYPAAVAAGSLLAVCSCTIVPLFAGIYKKGAGLGPAITFLFFAPAGNILALAYTGSILGADFAIARVVLCILFGIGIGLLMARLFWRDDATHDARTDALFASDGRISRAAIGLLLSLVAVLLAGTLKLAPLTAIIATAELPATWAEAWQATLVQWVPFDAARGEEGVSVQGSLLILLLVLIGLAAWKGLENIVEGPNRLDLDRPCADSGHAADGRTEIGPKQRRTRGRTDRARDRGRCDAAGLPALRTSARRRAPSGMAVGVVALREADLPAAGGGCVRGRCDPATD